MYVQVYVIACVYVLSVLALYCNNDVGYAYESVQHVYCHEVNGSRNAVLVP